MNEIIKEQLPPLNIFTSNLLRFSDIPSKKMFMIQCCNSPLLPKAALMGWEISGISEDAGWIEKLNDFVDREKLKAGNLIYGDYKKYDFTNITGKYDLLLTSGLLLHMSPGMFNEWIKLVKHGGIVYSIIPNCCALNGKIVKMLDNDLWQSFYRYSTKEFDELHQKFDLSIRRKANYSSGINIHMLIPWNIIHKKCKYTIVFKMLKYTVSILAKLVSPFVKDGNKTFNSLIAGIYVKK